MGKIQKRISKLPVKLEDLVEFILIGQQAIKAQKAKLAAIKALNKGFAFKEAALHDTQDMGEILLYAEAKLGGMLPKPNPTASRTGRRQLPEGISHKQSHYAHELNRHEDVIAKVVAKARKMGEVPIRQQVLRLIQENKPKPKMPPLPKGKYNVIYADPPWQYDNSGLLGAASKHYETMSIQELSELPVNAVVPNNAVLFMWVTNPLLEECFPVLKAWSFEYKTNMCWAKQGRPTYGKLGFYVRGQHELLLIATKGSMLPGGDLPNSIISEAKTKHSQKPNCVYAIIEGMYPKGKYLELFARNVKARKNWSFWGTEK